jgi:hypothetical protein
MSATNAKIRIPSWASKATVNGASATNGTLVSVACKAGTTTIKVALNPEIRVEKGWGSHGTKALPSVVYNAAGAEVPSTDHEGYALAGGAQWSGCKDPQHKVQDVRTGNANSVGTMTLLHPIMGEGHYITKVSMAFRYIAGYTPSPGHPKNASVVSINLLDASNGKPVTATPIWSSGPLGNYSYDNYKTYSPLQTVTVDNLKIPNSKALLFQVQIHNNQRNLNIELDSDTGLAAHVSWSTDVGPEPPQPPSPWLQSPTNGASITRGPIVFALHPKELKKVVKDYNTDLPVRKDAVDWEISTNDTWNYGLVLPAGDQDVHGAPAFDPTPSSKWTDAFPFDDSGEFPFSIKVQAKQLAAWGYWEGSKITAIPPSSPVNCTSIDGGCGTATEIKLTPFGGTNIRLSVFPWMSM